MDPRNAEPSTRSSITLHTPRSKRTCSQRGSPDSEFEKPLKMTAQDDFDKLFSEEKGFHSKSADFARTLNDVMVPNFAERAALLVKQTCDPMTQHIRANTDRLDNITTRVHVIEQRQRLAKSQMAEMRESILNLEAKQRENNLIFCGLLEQIGESEDDLYEKVKCEMKRIPNCDADNIAIESCYRRGQKNPDFGPRETVVVFLRVSAKQIVSKGRDHLSPNVKVKQDLPYELACMQRALMPIKNVAESLPQYKGKVRVTRGSLVIGNKSFNLSTLHEIPKDIDIAKGAWKSSDEVFAYFSVRTVFSNFRWAPITINGVLFENNEKYITFRKAELAKDESSIVAILECDNPYQMWSAPWS